MELKREIGSFTTVNGIRYTLRERAYPKTKTVWDGGVAGGRIYPCSEDSGPTQRFTHPDGFWVSLGNGAGGKSFPTFLKAADYARKRQYDAYVKAKQLVGDYDAQMAVARGEGPIDRPAFDAFWSQNQHLGFKAAREAFRALSKEGLING